MSSFFSRCVLPVRRTTKRSTEDIRNIWEHLQRDCGQEIADRVVDAVCRHFIFLERQNGVKLLNPQYSDIWTTSVPRAKRITIIYRWIIPVQPPSSKWTKHTSASGIHLLPPASERVPERCVLLRVVMTPKATAPPYFDLDEPLSQSENTSGAWISSYSILQTLHKKHGINSRYSNPDPPPSQFPSKSKVATGLIVLCVSVALVTLVPILIFAGYIALFFWMERNDRKERDKKKLTTENSLKDTEIYAQRCREWPDFLDSPKPPGYQDDYT